MEIEKRKKRKDSERVKGKKFQSASRPLPNHNVNVCVNGKGGPWHWGNFFNNQSVARKKRRVTRSVGYTEESFAKWKIKTSEPSNTTAVMDCHFVRPRVGGNSEQHEKKRATADPKSAGKKWQKGGWKPRREEGEGRECPNVSLLTPTAAQHSFGC